MTNAVFVRDVLDSIYPNLQPQAGLDQFIASQIIDISNNYANSSSSPEVNFSDPRSRFAYIFQYVCAHSRYFSRILHLAAGGNGLFQGGNINIACLGGGPGTDVIGLVKYFMETGYEPQVAKLNCCILDKEPLWAQNWGVVAQMLQAPIDPYFIATDVASPMQLGAKSVLSDADIITVSYLVSAVQKLDVNGVVTQYFQSCFATAKSGALLVYVDNCGQHTNYFDGIAAPAGWDLLGSWDWTPGTPKWGSFGEDVTALDAYQLRFGRLHKIAARLSYRVYRKP